MKSVPVLPIGSGELRFSGRKACEAWRNEPSPGQTLRKWTATQEPSSSAIPLTYSERMRTDNQLIGSADTLSTE